MDSDLRTPSGAPSQEARDKYAAGAHGSFPIFDRHSALSAAHLIGHATPDEREHIISKIAQYAPEAAEKIRSNG